MERVNSLQWTVYRILFILALLVLSLITVHYTLTTSASAHLVGQPPFFKVNGELTGYYNVPLTSLDNFVLPQDSAPKNYLVNTPVNFELDKTLLPAPPELIARTTFSWEFGDGGTGSGLKNTHTFTKPGSYIVNIYAKDELAPTPQIIQSTMVNILPNSSYQLPKAVITVNGQKSKDPLTDILTIDFSSPVKLDAKSSESSSPIVEYFWDFGDQTSGKESTATHDYQKDVTRFFPVLRIKTQDGFISDAFVEIQNKDQVSQFSPSKPPEVINLVGKKFEHPHASLIGKIIVGFLILAFVIAASFMVRWFSRGRYRGKRRQNP